MDTREGLRKAVVLCAGLGTRLGALTRSLPKAMLPIQGWPMLAYLLHYLHAEGIRDVAVNMHYLPEPIKAYFGDGSRFGIRLYYSFEKTLLGTAGAVKKLEPWLEDEENFLVLYGDILTDQPLHPLWRLHRRHDAMATLLLHQRKGSNSFVRLDGNHRITAFTERPDHPEALGDACPWVNSGVQILNRRALKMIPPGQPVDLPRDIYSKTFRWEKLFGLPLTGYRCAVDSPRRYAKAKSDVAKGRFRYSDLSRWQDTATIEKGG